MVVSCSDQRSRNDRVGEFGETATNPTRMHEGLSGLSPPAESATVQTPTGAIAWISGTISSITNTSSGQISNRSSRLRQSAAARQRQLATDLAKRIEVLEDQVGELALLCRSLLTVLREDGTVLPERLQAVMRQIDAEDGLVDGKVTPAGPPPDDPTTAPNIRTQPNKDRIR